jgi:RNA polymerase sigma factor (sigma-70 family)
MPAGGNSRTRVTLLGRLRADPTDQRTWAEFVDHYGPRIVTWCRTWDLQDADAQDVAQTVLLKLATTMRDFAYDPAKSFRAWLKTVAHHAWLDFLKARRRAGQGTGDSRTLDRLNSVEARDDLLGHLNAAFDQELLREAAARVRLRVAPQTWEAFRLTAEDGLSGAETAARVGMQAAQVYVAKRRVQAMLRDEIQKLEGAGPDAEEPPAATP